MSLNGLKKNLSDLASRDKKKLIDKNSPLSLTRQAQLLGMSRASIYYHSSINQKNQLLMNAIDQIYTDRSFYGTRKIRRALRNEFGLKAGRAKIATLMRLMGLEPIYIRKKPWLSSPGKESRIFPYLLRNLDINYPDQVWAADITYISLERGFCYLTAVMDWFSRYVIAWKLSSSLSSVFCIEALKEALLKGEPEIFNTDQGSQFTCLDFVNLLLSKNIRVSHDGKGRYLDNIFIERLWRTVKYENVYLRHYRTIEEAEAGLEDYFNLYNNRRIHQALEYETPAQVYFRGKVESVNMKTKQEKLSEIYLKKAVSVV